MTSEENVVLSCAPVRGLLIVGVIYRWDGWHMSLPLFAMCDCVTTLYEMSRNEEKHSLLL